MKKSVLLKAFVLSAITLGSIPMYALGEDIVDYDQGILTAKITYISDTKLTKQDVAANVTVINEESIERENFKTVSDALQGNNVNIVKKGFAAYPVLNGDSRVLVMVDGKKMNWDHLVTSGDDNAVDVNQIPMENIERIEVVHGPNSSLYGERAVSGVINIITKKAEPGSQTSINTEYGTWNHRRFGIYHSGGDALNRYRISFAKEKRDNYDYVNPYGQKREFKNSYIDHEDINLGYDRLIGDDRLSFDFSRHEKKDGFGNYLTDVANNITYGHDGDKLKETDLNYGVIYTFNAQSHGDGTFVRYYRSENKADSPFAGTPYSHDLSRDTFEGQKDWALSHNNKLIAGLLWAGDHLTENNDGSPMDRSAITKAAFFEDRWEFAHGFSINTGSRYEHHSDFGGDWTSHVSLNKKMGKNTHAYIAWGQGINNPTLKMRYADTPYMKGNPDLEQETSTTWSAGVESQITPKWSVAVNYYQSKVKNALNWKNDASTGNFTQYYNTDTEHRHGISLSTNYKVNDAWTLRGSFATTSVDSTDINRDYINRNTRPNIYSFGVAYTMNKWSADADLNYVTGLDRDHFSDNRYVTLDMGVNYQINESTKVYLKGYNLTDENYESIGVTPWTGFREIGSYAMPSRHFVGGVNYKF